MIPRKKIEVKKQEAIDSCTHCGGTACGECGAKATRIERYAYANIPVEYWEKSFKEFSGDINFKKIIRLIVTASPLCSSGLSERGSLTLQVAF